jgi:Flp pilus assembly protein TadD
MRRDARQGLIGDLRRAQALLEVGRVEAALEEALRALAADPRDADALELLAVGRLRLGRRAEARAAILDGLREAPQRPHLHYLLGFVAAQEELAAEAERELREAVAREPDEPVYLRALAEWLAGHGALDEALGLARRAVAIDPERGANHRTLGYVVAAAGRGDEAQAHYRRALALDPGDSDAWNNLGCVAMARGERLQAREHFRESLRLHPAGEHARRNLALVEPRLRPRGIYSDFDTFLGEVVRELAGAWRAAGRSPSLRLTALALAAGGTAVQRAFTARLDEDQPLARIGAAAGAVFASAAGAGVTRVLGPWSAILGAAAGLGWLATTRRVTPLRRRYAAYLVASRRAWEAERAAWLEGRLARAGHEAAVDRMVERLCLALDAEPIEERDG